MKNDDARLMAALHRRHGGVTPDLVVAVAAAADHPWHRRFEWDDKVAGAQYRRDQARELIRTIEYRISTDSRVLRSVGYVRDPDAASGSQGYVSVQSLRNDADRARSVLIAEFSRIGDLLSRARDLAKVLHLEAEFDRLMGHTEAIAALLHVDGPNTEGRPSRH